MSRRAAKVPAASKPEPLVDLRECLRERGLRPSDRQTQRWCREDALPYFVVGKRTLVRPSELDAWLEARRRNPPIQTLTPAAADKVLEAHGLSRQEAS